MSKTISFSTDDETAALLEAMAKNDLRTASNFLTVLIIQEDRRRAEAARITESWRAANAVSMETVKPAEE